MRETIVKIFQYGTITVAVIVICCRFRMLFTGGFRIPGYIHWIAIGSGGLGIAMGLAEKNSTASLHPGWLTIIFPLMVYGAFLLYGGSVGQARSLRAAGAEQNYRVRFDATAVECIDPQGKISRLEWSMLHSVEIHTNDSGPWGADVWWVLRSDSEAIAIPQGAEGDKQLLTRLQELPGFRNETVIEAMGCTSNRVFRCWTREN